MRIIENILVKIHKKYILNFGVLPLYDGIAGKNLLGYRHKDLFAL